MQKSVYRILAINPGSTSTKNGIFENEKLIYENTIHHDRSDLENCGALSCQKQYRRQTVLDALKQSGIEPSGLDAVVGRGGILKPLESGTYEINDKLIEDLHKDRAASHPSMLGGILAREIGDSLKIPSFIVDPVVVDELSSLARVTGIKGISRVSIFHALNSKAVARRVCRGLGKKYEESRIIVAHMGGGISVAAHLYGRVVDVNNGLDGDGPFSPERSGGVPLVPVIEMCFSGKYTRHELTEIVTKAGGMLMLIGTDDMRKAEQMIKEGDLYAALVVEAMAYQISKEIGAMAAVMSGRIDAVVLTGGLAHSDLFTGFIKERVDKFAPIFTEPGEGELQALAEGALAVLRGERKAKQYK